MPSSSGASVASRWPLPIPDNHQGRTLFVPDRMKLKKKKKNKKLNKNEEKRKKKNEEEEQEMRKMGWD